MINLDKNKVNQTDACRQSLKNHFIRTLQESKPAIDSNFSAIKANTEIRGESHSRTIANEMASTGGSERQNETLVQQLHMARPTKFKIGEYVKAFEGPTLQQIGKGRKLSPNTKLRILQRKLEEQRKLLASNKIDDPLQSPLPVFEGQEANVSPKSLSILRCISGGRRSRPQSVNRTRQSSLGGGPNGAASPMLQLNMTS